MWSHPGTQGVVQLPQMLSDVSNKETIKKNMNRLKVHTFEHIDTV